MVFGVKVVKIRYRCLARSLIRIQYQYKAVLESIFKPNLVLKSLLAKPGGLERGRRRVRTPVANSKRAGKGILNPLAFTNS